MNFVVAPVAGTGEISSYGEAAQARLLAALACPLTNGPVEVLATALAGGAVKEGAIFNRAGARVGRIANFQIDFVRLGEAEPLEALRRQLQAGELPRRIDSAPEWRLVSHDSPEIAYSVALLRVEAEDMVALDADGGVIAFAASGPIELQLFAHPWSGVVDIAFGDQIRTVDLYRPHLASPYSVALDLGPNPTRVEIRLTGRHNNCAFGRQCLFGGYRQPTGATVPLRHVKRPKVRGAPFGEEFYRLLGGVPTDGILLDVGGGNRQIDDPRYLNLDYADFVEPDLIADATRLPLRDASIDAVYSTGVFEHIADPLRAGAEVARVLKPGGRATVDWAFMQPIHSEGHHFYNATPWGVENAFKTLTTTRLSYATSFESLVRWGAEVSGLAGRVPASEIDAVCRTLARWDALIPEAKKAYMANGVWAEFEKPA